MNNLIRSELLKQRTVRLPLIAIAAAAITGALTAIAIITTSGHAGNPPLDRHSLTQLVHARSRSSPAPRCCSASLAPPVSSATRRSPAPCSSHHAAAGCSRPRSSSTPGSAPCSPSWRAP